MKISELIQELQEIQKEHGDFPVHRVYENLEDYPLREDQIEICNGCIMVY